MKTVGSKSQVYNKNAKHTVGGVTKSGLKKYKGRIVSKKKSALAKSNLSEWNKAVARAKRNLGYDKHEFILLNKGAKGKKLYKEAANLYY